MMKSVMRMAVPAAFGCVLSHILARLCKVNEGWRARSARRKFWNEFIKFIKLENISKQYGFAASCRFGGPKSVIFEMCEIVILLCI